MCFLFLSHRWPQPTRSAPAPRRQSRRASAARQPPPLAPRRPGRRAGAPLCSPSHVQTASTLIHCHHSPRGRTPKTSSPSPASAVLHLFVALAKPSHTCTPHQGFPRINGRTNAGRMPTTEEPHLTSAPGQCRASRERSKSQPLTQHASSAALKALGSSYQNKKETPSARAAQQAVAPPPRLHRSLGASPALLRAARRSLPGAAAGRVRR